jgi:hypothetical protein
VIRDESTFSAVMKDDSLFRPMGTKVHSFVSPDNSANLPSTGKTTNEYEVYHVCVLHYVELSINSQVFTGDLGYTWISGVSSSHAVVHPTLRRGRFIHPGRRRYMGVCSPVSVSLCWKNTWLTGGRFEKGHRAHSENSAYRFVGYSSLYPFYSYPEKVRLRLRLALALRVCAFGITCLL